MLQIDVMSYLSVLTWKRSLTFDDVEYFHIVSLAFVLSVDCFQLVYWNLKVVRLDLKQTLGLPKNAWQNRKAQ